MFSLQLPLPNFNSWSLLGDAMPERFVVSRKRYQGHGLSTQQYPFLPLIALAELLPSKKVCIGFPFPEDCACRLTVPANPSSKKPHRYRRSSWSEEAGRAPSASAAACLKKATQQTEKPQNICHLLDIRCMPGTRPRQGAVLLEQPSPGSSRHSLHSHRQTFRGQSLKAT